MQFQVNAWGILCEPIGSARSVPAKSRGKSRGEGGCPLPGALELGFVCPRWGSHAPVVVLCRTQPPPPRQLPGGIPYPPSFLSHPGPKTDRSPLSQVAITQFSPSSGLKSLIAPPEHPVQSASRTEVPDRRVRLYSSVRPPQALRAERAPKVSRSPTCSPMAWTRGKSGSRERHRRIERGSVCNCSASQRAESPRPCPQWAAATRARATGRVLP